MTHETVWTVGDARTLVTTAVQHDLLEGAVDRFKAPAFGAVDPYATPLTGPGAGAAAFYTRSLYRVSGVLLGTARNDRAKCLVLMRRQAGSRRAEVPTDAGHPDTGADAVFAAFAGHVVRVPAATANAATANAATANAATAADGGFEVRFCALTPANAAVLGRFFAFTVPQSLRSERTTIGMGDRLGRASAGHIRAARQFDCYPVLAQQSIRELEFTGRTFADVVADAAFLVFQEGYEAGYGADGDHLKTIAAIDLALDQKMPMVTLDLTDVMRPEVADLGAEQVRSAFAQLTGAFAERVRRDYAGRRFELGEVGIEFSTDDAERCALMYGPALDFAQQVDAHLRTRCGDQYDLEISIDETTTPTIPSHHYFIARELAVRGVTVNSLAPRFVGEFQKAIDYIGDIREFERQFIVHCRIAQDQGAYKVSVHSGSDKFSVYPAVGIHTDRRLHLKTSGTSWLESLRAVAMVDPPLYRLMHAKAIAYYPEALKKYHITADLGRIADLGQRTDAELPMYLDEPDCRQMLHITYGGLLNDSAVREPFFACLHRYEARYSELVQHHFEKHINLLGIDRRV